MRFVGALSSDREGRSDATRSDRRPGRRCLSRRHGCRWLSTSSPWSTPRRSSRAPKRPNRPVILQISENAVKFHHGRLAPIAAAATAVAAAAAVPASVHLDHVEDVTLLHASAENGVSSAMFDASKLDYDANVEATRAAAEWAHRRRHLPRSRARRGRRKGRSARARGAHRPGGGRRIRSRHGRRRLGGRRRQLARDVGADRIAGLRSHRAGCARRCRCRSCCTAPRASPTTTFARPSVPASRRSTSGPCSTSSSPKPCALTWQSDDTVTDPRKYLVPARNAIADAVAAMLGAID